MTNIKPLMIMMDHGKIIFVHLEDTSEDIVNRLTAETIDLIQRWDVKKPFLILYDMSRISLLKVTGYGQDKSAEALGCHPPDLYGKSAIVISRNALTPPAKSFLNQYQSPKIPYKLFYEHDEAMKWLRK